MPSHAAPRTLTAGSRRGGALLLVALLCMLAQWRFLFPEDFSKHTVSLTSPLAAAGNSTMFPHTLSMGPLASLTEASHRAGRMDGQLDDAGSHRLLSSTQLTEASLSTARSPMFLPSSGGVRGSVAGRNVHIVLGADRIHWPGVIGVVNSIRTNSRTPERLMLHLLTTVELEASFRAYLACNLMSAGAMPNGIEVVSFDEKMIPLLKVQTKLTNLESPFNFARFYMHQIFPQLHKALYLDADIIVQGDVVELFDNYLQNEELCAATFRKITLGYKGVASLKSEKLQKRFFERYSRKIPLHERGFNAGVFFFNLRKWAQLNLTSEVEYWIRANNREKLYSLGSQPPLVLSIFGSNFRCQQLPNEWHLDCLGCMGAGRFKTPEQLKSAKLLHWNGPWKPFKTGHQTRRAYRELFDPYANKLSECNVASSNDISGVARGHSQR